MEPRLERALGEAQHVRGVPRGKPERGAQVLLGDPAPAREEEPRERPEAGAERARALERERARDGGEGAERERLDGLAERAERAASHRSASPRPTHQPARAPFGAAIEFERDEGGAGRRDREPGARGRDIERLRPAA